MYIYNYIYNYIYTHICLEVWEGQHIFSTPERSTWRMEDGGAVFLKMGDPQHRG